MPIYEYECTSCGHEFEKLQKLSDPLLTECPACHEHSLRKKISAAAFKLKGTGWYETDFKDKGKKKPGDSAKSSDGASKSESKSGESKSESKPDSSSSSEKKPEKKAS